MTTALYRRYRPETFADVIGQEHVTDPLMAAVGAQRASHAYLFSGPRGCGKTTSARILARCLNCANGPTPVPCGTCDSCVELARGGSGSLDVVEIDAASHNGVDDARELRERAAFAPARDRYKIFILDEAHMVTTQGFNALLKLVEEPPPHVKFIFATTEPDKVISTIRSRTHHYPFRLVPPDRLQAYLERICTAEGVAVGSGVLPLVVRAGGGSVRDSLSVLDQLLAGADGELDYAQAVALLGYTPETLLDDVVEAFEATDGASVFRVVDRVIESGHDPRRFVEDLLQRLRDLIVIVAAGERAADVLRGVPEDQFARMTTQAQRLGLAQLSRAGDLTMAALTEMTGATSPRLQLELLCARLLLPAADEPVRGYGARIERLERQVESGVPGRAGGVSTATSVLAASSSADAATPSRKMRLPERTGPGEAPAGGVEPAARAKPGDQVAARAQAEPRAHAGQVAPAASAVPMVSEAAPASQAATEAAAAAPEAPHAHPSAAHQESPAAPRLESPRPQSKPTARTGAAPAPAGAAGPGPADEDDTPARPSSAGAPPAEEAPAEEATAGEPRAGLDTETVRRRWPEVLETLSRIRRASWTITSQNAQVVSVTGKALHLRFDTPGIASTFRNGRHAEVVEQALRETLGLALKIEAVADENAGAAGGARRSSSGAPAAEAPDHAARAAADWAAEGPRPSAPREPGARQGGSARPREHADPDQEGSQARATREGPGSGAAPERAVMSPEAGSAADGPLPAEPPGEYDAGPEFVGDGYGDPYAGAEYPGGPSADDGAGVPDEAPAASAQAAEPARAADPARGAGAAAPVPAAVDWPVRNTQVRQAAGGNAARGGSAEKPDGPRRDWLAEATAASSSGRLAGPQEPSPTPAGPDEWSPSDLDEPDVSDPDLDASPLMGAQLVQRVFGATVIDEIAVDPVGSPARSGT